MVTGDWIPAFAVANTRIDSCYLLPAFAGTGFAGTGLAGITPCTVILEEAQATEGSYGIVVFNGWKDSSAPLRMTSRKALMPVMYMTLFIFSM